MYRLCALHHKFITDLFLVKALLKVVIKVRTSNPPCATAFVRVKQPHDYAATLLYSIRFCSLSQDEESLDLITTVR